MDVLQEHQRARREYHDRLRNELGVSEREAVNAIMGILEDLNPSIAGAVSLLHICEHTLYQSTPVSLAKTPDTTDHRREIKGVKHRLKHRIQAIVNPVKIIRLIGPDGIKRVVVLWRSPFKRKILGKFEVVREFAVDSFLPDWKPVEFTTSNDFEKKNRKENP